MGAYLPQALGNFIAMGLHERGMPYLKLCLAGPWPATLPSMSPSSRVRSGRCRHALRDDASGGEETNAEAITRLSDMLSRLRSADYLTRMRLWMAADGGLISTTASHPATMPCRPSALWRWRHVQRQPSSRTKLYCGSSRRVSEAENFGAQSDVVIRPAPIRVIREFGRDDLRGRAMIAYLDGWSQRSPEEARAFFDEAIGNGASPRTTLLAALNVDLPDVGAARIAQLLRDGRLETDAIDALTGGQWVGNVSEAALVPVLELIAGPNLESGPQIPQIIGFRLYNRSLEAGPCRFRLEVSRGASDNE